MAESSPKEETDRNKTIITWKSKVQYKRSTPYISLIKHLSQRPVLRRGNEVECKLVMEDKKLSVIISLD